MNQASNITKEDMDLISDLEGQSEEQLRIKRSHERVALRAKVILLPGNSSDTKKIKLQGVTSDLSKGGCKVMFPMPIMVGDVYRLEFEIPDLELPMTFARCLRCRFIHESAFEMGFFFFTQLNLQSPAQIAQAEQARVNKSSVGDLFS